MTMTHTPPVAKPASSNLGWLWYFAILFVLAILATGILIAYNLKQQLKPEQFAAAKKHWQEHGPASYHLIYSVRVDQNDKADIYDIKVVDRKVVKALVNGLEQPSERFYHYGMEALYRYIQGFVDIDTKKDAPRTFLRATFDDRNGAVTSFTRRVMGSKQRVALIMEKFEF
jgi:hypothetical protein